MRCVINQPDVSLHVLSADQIMLQTFVRKKLACHYSSARCALCLIACLSSRSRSCPRLRIVPLKALCRPSARAGRALPTAGSHTRKHTCRLLKAAVAAHALEQTTEGRRCGHDHFANRRAEAYLRCLGSPEEVPQGTGPTDSYAYHVPASSKPRKRVPFTGQGGRAGSRDPV